jgi:lia operon protein LiaG
MRRLSAAALALVAGLSIAACDIKTSANGNFSFDIAAGKATDTWSRTYKVSSTGRFELINVNGRITAGPADGSEIIVEGRRSAKARSDEAAKDLLAQLEIREEVGESTVRVESRPPRLSGMSSHEIEWTIKVPKGVIVDLRTTNGGVRINDLANDIHARTTNGGVKGTNITPGIIEASAVNGGVEFELSSPLDATDSIEMETVNGGVELALPSESKATIAARCVNGGVHVDGLDITREGEGNDFERRRRLNGTLNGGGAKVNMSTTNGGVRLTRAGSKTS